MKRLKINTEHSEVRYSNWISTLIDLMKPTNMYLYGGRGTAKSTDILAKRIVDVVYDMPGAPLAIVADTYVNLLTNILHHVFIFQFHFGTIDRKNNAGLYNVSTSISIPLWYD